MATFWALLNGDEQLSTSLHFIDDSSIDTGRIINNSTLAVQQNKSYLWHVLSLYVGGCQLIEQAIETLDNDGKIITKNQGSAGEYYTFPSAEKITEFSARFGPLYQPSDLVNLLTSLKQSE